MATRSSGLIKVNGQRPGGRPGSLPGAFSRARPRARLNVLLLVVMAGLGSLLLAACDSAEDLIVGQLIVEDLIDGTGVAVESGDSIRVYYVLTRTDDDRICDAALSNNGANDPVGFRLGTGGLIEGFEQGMVGAKETGRRRITIPPNLGYGLDPPKTQTCIRSNEFLQFTVDLVEVIKG